VKLVGYYRYRGVPTAVYLTEEEWYKGYCATSCNGVEIEWAEIYLGTKNAPSALHVAVILLHELGHLAHKAIATPQELKKELTMLFKERIEGETDEVRQWQLAQELKAWTFAYVLTKRWCIPIQVFEEVVSVCTGSLAQLVMRAVKTKVEGGNGQ
jgi:hypothetical protein